MVRKESRITLRRVVSRTSSGPGCRAILAAGRPCASVFRQSPACAIIDSGFTSPSNINYLTGLGHSIFLTDLVLDAWTENWKTGTDDDGNPIWDVDGFLERTLNFDGRTFDVVLLWTALDYLPEALVVPVVSRLSAGMNPGGQVLAFFHTKSQGEETDALSATTLPQATTWKCR